MLNKINKTHIIGARLDTPTYTTLEKIAQKEKRTISDLVRLWIIDRLTREAKSKKTANR